MTAKDELLLGGQRAETSLATIVKNFLILGATAFGGPPVHIGMFRAWLVEELMWLSNERFAELFAMANCLPGPSSTQVAFAIGITKGGVIGGLLAGLSFILPGAVIMSTLGFVASSFDSEIQKPGSPANSVAVACSAVGLALVFIAVSGLVKKQVCDTSDARKLGMVCFGTGVVCLLMHPAPAWLNPALIFLGGLLTVVFPLSAHDESKIVSDNSKSGVPVAIATFIFLLYFAVAAYTVYRDTFDHGWAIPFLNAGMFVWGGGPVVLPMLMTYLTPQFIHPTIFLSGISFAEMMPGPVFNISCFLGIQLAIANSVPWYIGVSTCWACLLGPGIILTFGAYTIWDALRQLKVYQRALPGLNAAAVGLLLPTLFIVYDTLGERSPWRAGSTALAVLAYYLIEVAKMNVPLVVIGAGFAGLAWSFVN